MVKKVKLIDDSPVDIEATPNGGMSAGDIASMMKFLEAIDWKLWEMLKIMKSTIETDTK